MNRASPLPKKMKVVFEATDDPSFHLFACYQEHRPVLRGVGETLAESLQSFLDLLALTVMEDAEPKS